MTRLGVARGVGKGAGWPRSLLAGLLVSAPLLASEPLSAQDPVFDAKGFQPNREFFSQLPFEHIDSMTGNLLLTFTDLVLPGNAGFDLRIQRTYNSKIYDLYTNVGGYSLDEDSWAGLGWTLHLGRVLNPNNPNSAPIIEMPDGSRHQLYRHLDGNTNHYITKDYWTYDNVFQFPVLRLPNGLKYTFGHSQGGPYYVTTIEDPFGNKVVVTYATPPAPADVITSVSQQLVGGQTRTIQFTYNATLPGPQGPQAAGSLATMSFSGRTWTYTQKLMSFVSYTLLTKVQAPIGPPWAFGYNETNPATQFVLEHVDTPNGGELDYTYTPQVFYIGSSVVYSPAITKRQTSGRDVPAGTWAYVYSSSTDENETAITTPCGSKTTYSFLGIGPNANQDAWAIGALDTRTTANAGGMAYETEQLTWISSVPISNDAESGTSPQTHVALLGRRDVTRSGRSYGTSYTYSPLGYSKFRPDNFNDYGRPHTINETGDLTRKTSRTFFYGSSNDPSFGVYIVDKVESETVEAPTGGEVFTKTFAYDSADGFMTGQTIHGITTTYTPHSSGSGNIGKAEDENGNEVQYDYGWGVADEIDTTEYTITRVINGDSTVASQTRRGFTTSFTYDALTRPTKTTPPTGNAINTSYDNAAGTFVKVTRGNSVVTTSLDGFGRTSATSNAVNVKTDITYDACGRRTFESYAYTGAPNPIPGRTYQFDPVGRVTQTSEPGNNGGTTTVQYTYSQGVDVAIKDENQRTTEQDWSAFGDPSDARLASVEDADTNTTSYTYNTLGSLKQVTPSSGPVRQWTYYGTSDSNGAHGLLKSETHPENGTVSYAYDAAGNLKKRTDARGQMTTLTYDGNNRLIIVDRPGTLYDTEISYDASDNRTLLENGYVSSAFGYDSANRLTSRTDAINGKSFTTGYIYDSNDNVMRATYPSQRKVDYAHDAENRITSVKNGITSTNYASSINYHASGALASFTGGNGLAHIFGYNNRYRLTSSDVGTLLNLDFTYDNVGNVTAADDTRAGFDQQLVYDDLDRLTDVTGFAAGGFSYDSIGNRLSKTIAGSTTSYTYSPSTNRLASSSGAEPDSFLYDANGNLTTQAQGSYTYTPDHLLATATISGITTSYNYDGDNARKHKVDSGINRYYIHGLGGQVLGEYTDSCTSGIRSVRDYVYLGSRLLATVRSTATLGVAPTGFVAENVGSAPINVTVTTSDGCPTDIDITVAYATSNGTATAGTDYTATSGVLTIAAGTPSGTGLAVMVPIINDTAIESNETFKLTLSNPLGATLGTPTQTVTILDNDKPVVEFVSPTSTVGENGNWITPLPSVKVTSNDGNALTVAATVKFATANITATAGSDYTAKSGTLTFAAGLPSGSAQTIAVTILQDTVAEVDETFKITLSAPTNATLGPTTVDTITLQDDEPTVLFALAFSNITEGSPPQPPPTVLASVIIRTAPSAPKIPAAVTVAYNTTPGTANANVDYTTTSGTLMFPAGSPDGTSLNIEVPILVDTLNEPDETFSIKLTNPTNARLGTPATHTVTIDDDDGPPLLWVSSPTVTEPNGANTVNATFTLTLSQPSGLTVSVKYATANASATAPSDYTAKSGTVTFAPGTTAKSVSVVVKGGSADEDDEAFLFNLSNPSNLILGQLQAQGTIKDNDGAPSPCTPILVAPFSISSPGRYCVEANLQLPVETTAIGIASNDVALDLQDHVIATPMDAAQNSSAGVLAQGRSNVTVRNGSVRGFDYGIRLDGPFSAPARYVVRNVSVQGTATGIYVSGAGSTVEGCRVTRTQARMSLLLSPYGGTALEVFGMGASVADNDLIETYGLASQSGHAINLGNAPASSVRRNRITNADVFDANTYGVRIDVSEGVAVLKNAISGTGSGIHFGAGSTGTYRGNTTVGVMNPYTGGVDAGGNH